MRRVNDELEGMRGLFIFSDEFCMHDEVLPDKLPTWLNASWWARKVSRGESLAWQRLSYKLIQIFEVACFNSLLYLVPTIPLYSNLWENESQNSLDSASYIYIDTAKRNICLMIYGNLFHLETCRTIDLIN